MRAIAAAGSADEVARREIEFAGQAVVLDASGALALPDAEALVVADLHLEKGSSFAARRQFVPPYDTAATLAALTRAIARFRPKLVISLGDAFHDGEAERRMAAADAMAIRALTAGRDWVWISGNHDPAPPGGFPGRSVAECEAGGIRFRHVPSPAAGAPQMAGHLHPAAKVKLRIGAVRRRCFITDGRVMVLPAFGAYTGGLNVRDRAFDGVFPDGGLTAWCIGDRRIHAVDGRLLLGD